MAFRAATATGAFNTAATWLQGTNTPSIHASTNVNITSANSFSATFTAPNTTNATVGLLVHLVTKGAATTMTATLQESTVDTAHTATITLSNVNENSWIFFKPASPYTFTTVGAGAYRWKLVVDTGTATVVQASTANFAYVSLDNRQVVPVSGDNVYIVEANGTTAATITMDGTQTIGTNVASGVTRSITNALYIGAGGILNMDTTASSSLTHRGDIFIDKDGELNCGTSGSPLSSSFTATLQSNTNNTGITIADGGKSVLQGTPKSSTSLWKTTLVSGVGTAASPMVVASSVDWVVGDEILIAASSDDATNYNQTESRFIITKNSATSYVLSATSGGGEAAFANTHIVGTDIVNVQRNIIIKGQTASSVQTFYMPVAQTNTGNIDVDWVRFENLSNSNLFGVVSTRHVGLANNTAFDYCVGYQASLTSFNLSGSVAGTYTGLISYSTQAGVQATLTSAINTANCANKTLVDCIVLRHGGYNLGMEGSASNLFTRFKSIGGGNAGGTGIAGLFITSSNGNKFVESEWHANRGSGADLTTGAANTFVDCLFGTKGTHVTSDVYCGAGYNTTLFESCVFDSSTLISNYLNMTLGSEIRFNRYQDTDNSHRWYDIYGHGISESTVIRSPGLSVKLVPENLTTGFTWSFKVPVVQNSIAGFRGYFLKNASLGTGVTTVSMYLPDNPVSGGVPDVSATLDNTTGSTFNDDDEQSVSLTTEYDGDIPGAATLQVNVKSTTGGAALYCDDFFNAGDRTTTFDSITGLNVWSDGKPLEVISPSVPSADDTAAAVWSALTGANNTAGTMGGQLNKTLTTGKFLALK